uniref:C-type lectin domain-containing protein n=1 Tax=Sinocyclocheilus grahami TaxID=75366 RepID=A0A672R0E2_SINGR
MFSHLPSCLWCSGSDSVKIRSSRAAAVCLVLLCVLLSSAVCPHQYKQHKLHTRDTPLLTRNTNLTEEREQLLTTIKALKDQLAIKNEDFTAEQKELLSKNDNLMKQNEKLNQQNNDLQKRLVLIVELSAFTERWKCYQSSLFYLSSERKSWTESRRYCTERGANLIIINNREEQEFVRKWSDKDRVWIGLTDSDVEGSWKWVDGSTPTSGFWMSAEPDEYRGENCALIVVGEWADHPCTEEFNWMCERSTV